MNTTYVIIVLSIILFVLVYLYMTQKASQQTCNQLGYANPASYIDPQNCGTPVSKNNCAELGYVNPSSYIDPQNCGTPVSKNNCAELGYINPASYIDPQNCPKPVSKNTCSELGYINPASYIDPQNCPKTYFLIPFFSQEFLDETQQGIQRTKYLDSFLTQSGFIMILNNPKNFNKLTFSMSVNDEKITISATRALPDDYFNTNLEGKSLFVDNINKDVYNKIGNEYNWIVNIKNNVFYMLVKQINNNQYKIFIGEREIPISLLLKSELEPNKLVITEDSFLKFFNYYQSQIKCPECPECPECPPQKEPITRAYILDDFVQYTAAGTDLPNQPMMNMTLDKCLENCSNNSNCIGVATEKSALGRNGPINCWLKQSHPNPVFKDPIYHTYRKII